MDDIFTGYGEEPSWDESRFMLSLLSSNERMGVALAFIYNEHPELKAKVARYLADYPFTFSDWETDDGLAY